MVKIRKKGSFFAIFNENTSDLLQSPRNVFACFPSKIWHDLMRSKKSIFFDFCSIFHDFSRFAPTWSLMRHISWPHIHSKFNRSSSLSSTKRHNQFEFWMWFHEFAHFGATSLGCRWRVKWDPRFEFQQSADFWWETLGHPLHGIMTLFHPWCVIWRSCALPRCGRFRSKISKMRILTAPAGVNMHVQAK